MAKSIKTPGSTPHKTLIKEMLFTYIQGKVGMHKLARLMKTAKEKDLIKTPRQFRFWLVDEMCKSVDVIEEWLANK